MFEIKLFADFECSASADTNDRKFLQELIKIRDSTTARFVNLSVYDYSKENPDCTHFLTYPNDWISYYARHFYSGVDPLLTMDYRRVSYVDWREIHIDGKQMDMFEKFAELGLGNNAVSVINHSQSMQYVSLSLVFRCPHDSWQKFKHDKMPVFRFEGDRITECFNRIYGDEPELERPLTRRELQALKLVAIGNTDEEIATQMGIGRWTVVSHLQSAKYKLGSANRAAAVAKAITRGMIDIKRAI
jgi:DNA-binding CsgD family transcriptional regulator